MLGVLMAFVITGSVWAEAPKCVDEQGNYEFDSGTLNGQFVDLYTDSASATGSTDITIKDNGTINVIRNGGWAAIDIYNGEDAPASDDSIINVSLNGNIIVTQTASSNDVRAINLLAGNSILTMDGNLIINQIYVNNDEDDRVWCEGIRSYGGDIILNGDTTIKNIDIKAISGKHVDAVAIYAIGDASIEVNGDLSIESIDVQSNGTKYVTALTACDGAVISVNKDKNKDNIVQIVGDVDADSENAKIELNLLNESSFLEGASLSGEGIFNLVVDDGATWKITDRHFLGDPEWDKEMKNSYVTTLSGDGGIIKMDIDASQKDVSNKLFVDKHTGTHYVQLNNTGSSDDGAEGTVLIKVKDEKGVFKANDEEGTLFWNKYDLASRNTEIQTIANDDDYKTEWYLKKVEQITPSDKPTTSVSMAVVDSSLVYHTWRTENDKLMQRMGELRLNGADEQGAWFRVKGTKINHSGNLGFENEYTTYELGYDKLVKQTEEKSCYQGVALSYTDGEAKYFKGSGDNESKSIGFYRTEVGKKGDYLDLVVRVSDSDNKYSVYDTNSNKITGDTNNWGIALSAEAGRKNMLSDGWYVEPQAQFTIGHLNGDSYKTSNGIYVEQDDIFSAVGRLGVNVGKELGEKGIVYVKANLLHEFAGDFDVNMSDSSGNVSVGEKFDDTWFEYGLGLSYQTGKNNYIYFDVEKTSGSDFEKEWSWNAGVRWFF